MGNKKACSEKKLEFVRHEGQIQMTRCRHYFCPFHLFLEGAAQGQRADSNKKAQ